MNGKWGAFTEHRHESRKINLWLIGDGEALEVRRRKINTGRQNTPSLTLFDDEMKQLLQAIVNEAAKIGIVALDASTAMEAQRKHLADMRAIALKSCGLDAALIR